MEFLMTYGWAILVIIIVVAVLFYMGIMNTKNTMPDSCVLAPGFSCYIFKVAGPNATLYLDLGQTSGGGIVVTGVECSENSTPQITGLTNPVYIAAGEHRDVTGGESGNIVNCTDADGNPISAGENDKFSGTVAVNYTTLSDNTTHVVYGDMRAAIGPNAPIIGGNGCAPDCASGSGCSSNSQCLSGVCVSEGGGFGFSSCIPLITDSATCRSTEDTPGSYCCCVGDPGCSVLPGCDVGTCDGGALCNSPSSCYLGCSSAGSEGFCLGIHTIAGAPLCTWVVVYPTPVSGEQGICD